MFKPDYAAAARKLTPAQRKANKIARLEALQARREAAMADPDAANATQKWWELMTKRHIAAFIELNQLKGLPAFGEPPAIG